MRRIIFILLISLLSFNNAYENNLDYLIDQNIIKDLILIKNTYEYVNDNKIRAEMIRRQNRLVGKDKRYLYEKYLIQKSDGELINGECNF